MRLLFLIILASCAYGAEKRVVSIMPENTLHLDYQATQSDITYEQYVDLLVKIDKIYDPIVKRLGAELIIYDGWEDNTVNAYASQQGKRWIVEVMGGLARRNEITLDALAIVTCHELGHHLGGYPTYPREWASAEGNSDYYSTQACIKKVFNNDYENKKAFDSASIEAKEVCQATTNANYFRCVRAVEASWRLTSLFASANEMPDPLTPDDIPVYRTETSYPKTTQCRLDTYIAGAICTKKWNDLKIPRYKRDLDYISCTLKNKELGVRPSCWYAE